MEGYDIIGDIHGYANILEHALKEMGYNSRSGAYAHTSRKAVFVGDLINKGPDIKSTVGIVRSMVDSGAALCVIGNHEWNLLRLLKLSAEYDLNALRETDLITQCEHTLDSYGHDQSGLNELKQWIEQLPLFIENQNFRVVHAAWLPKDIAWLKDAYGPTPLAHDCLGGASDPSNHTSEILQRLLNGVDWPFLPVNQSLSDTGTDQELYRMAWWQNPGSATRLENLIVRDPDCELESVNESEYRDRFTGYPNNSKPVFLGHYCMTGEIKLQAHNVFCIDWCIYKTEALTVYRWSGEARLLPEHIYSFKP